MIASEYYQPQLAELKVVTADKEAAMHAIPGKEKISATEPVVAPKIDMFTINFSYNGKEHNTKVVKSGSNQDEFFYKVVLSSHVCDSNGICWLQRGPQGWATLLGKVTDADLMAAITTAIENRA